MDHIDDVSVEYVEDGRRRRTDKHILSKGAWSTIVFKYREWDIEQMPWTCEIHHTTLPKGQRSIPTASLISVGQAGKSADRALSSWLDELNRPKLVHPRFDLLTILCLGLARKYAS